MKLGAERKKVALLSVLTVVAGYSVYTQLLSDSTGVADPSVKTVGMTQREMNPRIRTTQKRSFSRVGFDSVKESFDPMTNDPTLRTELLEKVRAVTFEGVQRDLFRFSQRKKLKVVLPTNEEIKKAQSRLNIETKHKKSLTSRELAKGKPNTPQIRWKYYGFANSSKDTRKRAFLIGDDDQIFIATEGDILQKRYLVVRVGVNSIVIEDLEFNDQQSLPLEQG